jgi:uncharacterized protein (TIGR03067 family)
MRSKRWAIVLGILAVVIAEARVAWPAEKGQAPDKATQDDRQKLIGVWTGNWGPLRITLTITPTEITAVKDGKEDMGAGTYVIDTDKKHLDATRTRGPDAKGTHLGIYELEGDVLKWCVNRPKQGRPQEMRQGPRDGGGWLGILKRVPTPPAKQSP